MIRLPLTKNISSKLQPKSTARLTLQPASYPWKHTEPVI